MPEVHTFRDSDDQNRESSPSVHGTKYYSKCFTYVNSFSPPNNPFSPAAIMSEETDTEGLGNLTEVTQLVKDRARL